MIESMNLEVYSCCLQNALITNEITTNEMKSEVLRIPPKNYCR